MCDQAPAVFNPPTLSANEMHEILLTAHAGGNVIRRRFIDALRALEESKLYVQLGFSSLAGYTEKTFRYGRSHAYNFVRISRALDSLPQLALAFECGELSFSLLSRLTKVAVSETESQWIEHCRKHPMATVDMEIRDAIKQKRNHPRKDGYGLPGLPSKVSFELMPQEHAIVAAAINKIRQEMSLGLDGVKPEPKAALLYLSRRLLETGPDQSITAGRTERAQSPYAVVYHRCPTCLRAAVETEAGRVEICAHVMDRIEPYAEAVVIEDEIPPPEVAASSGVVPREERDGHNTPKIRFEAQMREGGRCANPYCRCELGGCGYAHHIQYWSEGGRTALWNISYVCGRCHGLLHQGLLTILGDPVRGLEWKVACEDITRTVREALAQSVKDPLIRLLEIQAPSTHLDATTNLAPELSAIVIQALGKLGWSQRQAKDLLARACERLRESGQSAEASDASALVKAANQIGWSLQG